MAELVEHASTIYQLIDYLNSQTFNIQFSFICIHIKTIVISVLFPDEKDNLNESWTFPNIYFHLKTIA